MIYGVYVSFIGGENGGQVVIPTAHYSDTHSSDSPLFPTPILQTAPYFRHPFFRQPIAPTAHYSDSPLLRHPISPTTHYSVKNSIIKSPKQRLETYCFCSVCYYYYYYYYYYSCYSPFFPCTMNLSTADLRNYRTEFHETWWSYRYMFLVDPKVFRFVVKGVKAIFWGVQKVWGLL